MTEHKTGTREEWLAARLDLLRAEKELTRRSDELARQRQQLPWVRVDKEYRFDTDEGAASLADLFLGRSQLLVYHFMFGPDYTAGCPSCSAIADGFSGSAVHLANHDVTLCAVSRAPLAKIQAYKRRMGWGFPFASSYGGDFNLDFGVAHTKEEWEAGAVTYNFGQQDLRPAAGEKSSRDAFSQSIVGTDWETYRREGPGMSAFALEDGVVYCSTYSAVLAALEPARNFAAGGCLGVRFAATTASGRDLHSATSRPARALARCAVCGPAGPHLTFVTGNLLAAALPARAWLEPRSCHDS